MGLHWGFIFNSGNETNIKETFSLEIYLDNCATTKVCPEAAEAALNAMVHDYGNPSSLHKKGLDAEHILTAARKEAAALLGCEYDSVYFTGGATDSNNIAIQGSLAARPRGGKTIVTTTVEHPSVGATISAMEKKGYTVKRIAPKADGHFDPYDFLDAVDEDTVLLSMMMVNNELGTILPYEKVVPAVKKRFPDLIVHIDGVQGFTKLPLSVTRLGVDLFSFSGHKLYAPKGIGGLYIRKGLRILPVEYGGGQEKGLRSGTESVPMIAGMSAAFSMIRKHQNEINENYRARNLQLRKLLSDIPYIVINSPQDGCPHLLNLSVPGIPSEIMLHALEEKEIYVSSGSACSKGAQSSTLAAYHLPQERIRSALRISFSRETTEEEINLFAAALKEVTKKLKKVVGC